MEIFAVYWEPVIKTYGIVERTGLCLVSLQLTPERIPDIALCLTHRAAEWGASPILVFVRPVSGNAMRLHLLLDRPLTIRDFMALDGSGDAWLSGMRIDDAVELVSLQGPHYGDRYGILSAAIKALADHGTPLLALSCAAASISLIFPQGYAGAAVKALETAFAAAQPSEQPKASSDINTGYK